MRLPVAQRTSVILMDVLGYSLQEIGEVMDFSLPAVKAALHRGRAGCANWRRSRTILPHPELSTAERSGSRAYVDALQRARLRRHPRDDRR